MNRTVLTTALLVAFPLAAVAQDVVATRAGLIYSFEGEVHVDERALEQSPTRFPMLPKQSVLRVSDGEATLVLAPGVLLDVRTASEIRLIDNGLLHPVVELITGSVRLRCKKSKGLKRRHITVYVGDVRVDVTKRGDYTLEKTPPQLTVTKGEATVADRGDSIEVEAGDSIHLTRGSEAIALQRFGSGQAAAEQQ